MPRLNKDLPMPRLLTFLFLCTLTALVAGCSNPQPGAPGSTTPHAEAFKTGANSAEFHGKSVQNTGTDSCRVCHGLELTGNASLPGCDACHFGPEGARTPAAGSWTHGTIPHDQLLAQGEVCNSCHTINRAAENGPAPCHDCHGSGMSHPPGRAWLDKTQTGYHGTSSQHCASCHDLEVKCIECHFGATGSKVPEGVDWQHGTTPHDQLGLTGPNAVCLRCHEVNRSYGNGPDACHDCHTHAKGQDWLDRDRAEFHGRSTLECANCHDLESKCVTCHFDSSGSKVPEGATWQHGTIPHDQSALTLQHEVCLQCHEVSRTYGNGPENCHDCHIHATGREWLDKNQATFHGTSEANCAGCHDLEDKCTECHFGPTGSKIPAGVDWQHGTTPHGELGLTGPNQVCINCHTLNRSYDNGPGACHDCHTHPTGQEWLDRTKADFHGNSELQCFTCHDLETKCVTCHFGSSGSKVPTGTDWQHGTVPHNQAVLTEHKDVCLECHGLNRSYGNTPGECHDCHIHPGGQAWLDRDQPEFHGTSTLDCAGCHDLNVKCAECHFGPSGSKVPAGIDWAHGTIPHADPGLAEAGTVCATCHTVSREYENGPAACHDCHIHPTGQAWLDKNQPDFHGTSTMDCGTCHDLNVKCVECHFGAGGSKIPSGTNWTHGTVPHNEQVLLDNNATCTTCHDLNRSFSNPPANCHDCHLHPIGQEWLDKTSPDFHGTSTINCADCHDLGVKCYECHFGPTGSKVPAGASWTHGTIPHDAQILADQGVICATCHDLNRSYGHLPANCHDCHLEASHILGADWINATTPDFHGGAAETEVYLCQQCHGLDFLGGGAGVSCASCHTAGNPMETVDCLSCHATPPDTANYDVGNRPNRAGAHATHLNLTVATSTCTACHDGAGSGTVDHYDTNAPGNVTIAGDYDENGLTAAYVFDAGAGVGNCSNVRCHGGATIVWTAAITTNTDCVTCHHIGDGDYNSPVSGRHASHMDQGDILCTECHDTAKLAGRHFNDLDTTAVNEADQTITLQSTWPTESVGTYSGGKCSVTCHGKMHMNPSW